jgi:hypothetical protein
MQRSPRAAEAVSADVNYATSSVSTNFRAQRGLATVFEQHLHHFVRVCTKLVGKLSPWECAPAIET